MVLRADRSPTQTKTVGEFGPDLVGSCRVAEGVSYRQARPTPKGFSTNGADAGWGACGGTR